MKNIYLILLSALVIALIAWVFIITRTQETETQVTVPQNEPVSNEFITVDYPREQDVIESPLNMSGTVRGSWLFEANAPVILTDWDGRILAEGYIEAEGEWMTGDYVPFTGTLEFETPEDIGDFSDTGSIIFQRANPSDMREHDMALEYIIRFR